MIATFRVCTRRIHGRLRTPLQEDTTYARLRSDDILELVSTGCTFAFVITALSTDVVELTCIGRPPALMRGDTVYGAELVRYLSLLPGHQLVMTAPIVDFTTSWEVALESIEVELHELLHR